MNRTFGWFIVECKKIVLIIIPMERRSYISYIVYREKKSTGPVGPDRNWTVSKKLHQYII